MMPVDVATDGYLRSPLSIATNGYLFVSGIVNLWKERVYFQVTINRAFNFIVCI